MSDKYGKVKPSVVITADELADLEAPFVVDVAGEQYALKSINGFSVDDASDIADIAEEDVVKVLPLIAVDKESEEFLRSCGSGVLKAVIRSWFESQDVSLGESGSSAS